MTGLRRKFALSTISHLQFEGRKCAVPLLSHLQHKDKVVQREEKLCSTRIATSAVAAQVMWCGKIMHYKECHICSARRKIFYNSRVASTVQGEGCAVCEGKV